MSRLYGFILNMWVMGKDEDYVNRALEKGYITEDERNLILLTPQNGLPMSTGNDF